MSFRAWADVPETERVTEQSIRAYWEQRAKEAPDAPFVQRVDEFIDREVNTLRERLRSGSCEAAVASYGNVAPYLPCMHPQTTGSRFCWAHDRVAKRTGCETVSDYDRLVAAARMVIAGTAPKPRVRVRVVPPKPARQWSQSTIDTLHNLDI